MSQLAAKFLSLEYTGIKVLANLCSSSHKTDNHCIHSNMVNAVYIAQKQILNSATGNNEKYLK